MIIIGAFIGTEDLGQEIMQTTFFWRQYWKWSNGLVYAWRLSVFQVDHLIQTWATKRRQLLGID